MRLVIITSLSTVWLSGCRRLSGETKPRPQQKRPECSTSSTTSPRTMRESRLVFLTREHIIVINLFSSELLCQVEKKGRIKTDNHFLANLYLSLLKINQALFSRETRNCCFEYYFPSVFELHVLSGRTFCEKLI